MPFTSVVANTPFTYILFLQNLKSSTTQFATAQTQQINSEVVCHLFLQSHAIDCINLLLPSWHANDSQLLKS